MCMDACMRARQFQGAAAGRDGLRPLFPSNLFIDQSSIFHELRNVRSDRPSAFAPIVPSSVCDTKFVASADTQRSQFYRHNGMALAVCRCAAWECLGAPSLVLCASQQGRA